MPFDISRAEPGYTGEAGKATEVVVQLLSGFTFKLAYSILTNAAAIVICHRSSTESKAVDEARVFRRELERAIRLNYQNFNKGKPDDESKDQGA